MKNKEPKNYKDAWKELQGILSDLEAGKLDVDKIAESVKRASILVEYCQNRLRSVEKELENAVD